MKCATRTTDFNGINATSVTERLQHWCTREHTTDWYMLGLSWTGGARAVLYTNIYINIIAFFKMMCQTNEWISKNDVPADRRELLYIKWSRHSTSISSRPVIEHLTTRTTRSHISTYTHTNTLIYTFILKSTIKHRIILLCFLNAVCAYVCVFVWLGFS